jgi:uncharacterized membrane protein
MSSATNKTYVAVLIILGAVAVLVGGYLLIKKFVNKQVLTIKQ